MSFIYFLNPSVPHDPSGYTKTLDSREASSKDCFELLALTIDWYCNVCDNTSYYNNKSTHQKTKKHQTNLQSNLLHLSPDIFN